MAEKIKIKIPAAKISDFAKEVLLVQLQLFKDSFIYVIYYII